MSAFELHPKLAKDTTEVVDLNVCKVLLMEDARFPWLILVPRLPELTELHEIPRSQRGLLFDEIEAASVALQAITDAHKINVAALGNQVRQLHIHVIARHTTDEAWPGPVWGLGTALPYKSKAREELISLCRKQVAANLSGATDEV